MAHCRVRLIYSRAMLAACLLLLLAVPLAAQEGPLTPFQEQKARALFRDRLACLGCHELDGHGGRSGPSLTTVGQRRNGGYIRAVIEDPQRVVPGAAMPRILMPEATRELVVRYLAQKAAAGAAPPPVARQPTHSAPDAQYAQWCSSCHGARGNGDGPNARYLPVRPAIHSSAAQMSARSDDALFDAIAGGGEVMGKSARMPAFGASFSTADIRGLVAYIRALCACQAPAWSLDGKRQ
jgi:mono/diheme cytochrome c family protein